MADVSACVSLVLSAFPPPSLTSFPGNRSDVKVTTICPPRPHTAPPRTTAGSELSACNNNKTEPKTSPVLALLILILPVFLTSTRDKSWTLSCRILSAPTRQHFSATVDAVHVIESGGYRRFNFRLLSSRLHFPASSTSVAAKVSLSPNASAEPKFGRRRYLTRSRPRSQPCLRSNNPAPRQQSHLSGAETLLFSVLGLSVLPQPSSAITNPAADVSVTSLPR